jgi:hypothetical protein
MNWLVEYPWCLRADPWRVIRVARRKCWACGCHTIVVGVQTVLDCVAKCVHVPAIDKITVEAVAGSVAVGENELSTRGLIDIVSSVQNFEK